jgi:HTH-type transcriptional regulator/antitoxin HigA
MKPRVLKTESDYQEALAEIEAHMDAAPSCKQELELELWSLLVESYEREHHPIDTPDPVEAIRFRIEQQGLRPGDLTPFFRRRSFITEVLGRKRPLTLPMIRALSSGLHIPAEVLIRQTARPVGRRKLKAA